jgi:hypothetical protein
MSQNRPILNCNNNINCNIWHAEFAAFVTEGNPLGLPILLGPSQRSGAKSQKLIANRQKPFPCRRHRRRQMFIATAAIKRSP